MSWNTPVQATTNQVVTAAFWNAQIYDNFNFLNPTGTHTALKADELNENAIFTDTSFTELDNLTGTPMSRSVEVEIETGTEALVIVSARQFYTADTFALLAVSVSGASTIAASSASSLETRTSELQARTRVHLEDGLTAGTNTFTLEARGATGGSNSNLNRPSLAVIPL